MPIDQSSSFGCDPSSSARFRQYDDGGHASRDTGNSERPRPSDDGAARLRRNERRRVPPEQKIPAMRLIGRKQDRLWRRRGGRCSRRLFCPRSPNAARSASFLPFGCPSASANALVAASVASARAARTRAARSRESSATFRSSARVSFPELNGDAATAWLSACGLRRRQQWLAHRQTRLRGPSGSVTRSGPYRPRAPVRVAQACHSLTSRCRPW